MLNHNKETRVLLLRHAETAAPDRFHGAESDIGLSERGRWGAEQIAPMLAAERPAAVISSGMRRAIDTAEPIARACGLTLQVEPQLHERRIGTLSGTPYDARSGPWADTWRRWLAGETGYSTEGAESFDQMRDRVLPVWHRLAAQHAGCTYVVIAHGAVIKTLLVSLLGPGVGWDDFACPNLGLHELARDTLQWRLVRANALLLP